MSMLLVSMIACFTALMGPSGVGQAVTIYLLMSVAAGRAL